MARVLIAGCGYVGEATADLLSTQGWQVEGWTRSAESKHKVSEKPYRIRAVDISDAAAVADCAGEFEAVIHCASSGGGGPDMYRAVYLDGVRHLMKRFPTSRILFTSSTSVYGQNDGAWVTEESATTPTREIGRVLLEAEKSVLAHGGIVARLAGIYGPGRSAMLRKFLNGETSSSTADDRFVNQVHREDIVTALVLLMDRRPAHGEIYNVVDDEPIRESDCYAWLAKRLGRRTAPNEYARPNRKRGDSNKRVSNIKLRSLGWRPRYHNFTQAMEKSILPSFGVAVSTLS